MNSVQTSEKVLPLELSKYQIMEATDRSYYCTVQAAHFIDYFILTWLKERLILGNSDCYIIIIVRNKV